MSQGIALLDEALELARQEKTALEDGAYEEAIALAEKRGQLTSSAWNALQNDEQEPYKARLLQLSTLQEQLVKIATGAQDIIRQRLKSSRQQKKRILGYHQAVTQALQ